MDIDIVYLQLQIVTNRHRNLQPKIEMYRETYPEMLMDPNNTQLLRVYRKQTEITVLNMKSNCRLTEKEIGAK